MVNAFLMGETIYLRPLQAEDANGAYPTWLNDAAVCQYNSHHTFPYTRAMALNYIHSVEASRQDIVLAIVEHNSDEHIGNISLQSISWVSRSAEFAILIGDARHHGQGVGKQAGVLIIQHGFQALNLHRIYCGTSSDNIGMQKLAQALGMTQEGRRIDALYKNGRYVDSIEYGLIKK